MLTPETRTRRRGPRLPVTVAVAGLAAALATSTAAAAAPAPSYSRVQGQHAVAAGSMVIAWGRNTDGELGDGTAATAFTPVPVKLPPGTKVTSVRSGCESSIALTATGRVLDWGFGTDGELGTGKKTSSMVPVAVRLPAGTKATAVRAGCGFNMALTAAGRVLTWGFNPADVRLAVAVPPALVPVPVKFPAGTKVTGISAGLVFALAVTAKGQVYAWGGNDRGELGNGTRKSSHVPVRVRLPAGVKVTAVAAGQDFAVARTSTGKLLAWGSDGSGQLGTGHKGGLSKVPVRVQLPGGTKVAGLFAGCAHALALTGAGSILSWGLNGEGQLGDGTTTDRARPVHVRLPAGTRATAISAGCDHSLARDSLGHVLAWGSGDAGELGNNSQEDRHLPVQVILPVNTAAIAIGAGPAARSGLAIIVPAM